MRIAILTGLLGMLFALRAEARRLDVNAHRRKAEQTLIQGTERARIAPVTRPPGYQRADEPWNPESRIELRDNFKPELQRSIGDLPVREGH